MPYSVFKNSVLCGDAMNTMQLKVNKEMSNRRCLISGLFSMKDQKIDEKLAQITSEIENLGGKVVGRLFQRRGVSRAKKPKEGLKPQYVFA